MPAKITAFCQETGQPVPATPGAMLRCVYESLALLYAITRTRVEKLTGRKIKQLHIVGGGSKNDLLNQFTANALQVPVLAGPKEATAIGNIVVQAIALGHLKNLAQARDVVRRSCDLVTFKPKEAKKWQAALKRFEKVCAK